MKSETFTVGRNAGAAGRAVRLVAGALAVTGGVAGLARAGAAGPAVAGFLGAAAFYLALHGLLGERLIARLDPFVATLIVLGPLGLQGFVGVPGAARAGVDLYVGTALIATGAMAYGGCEVVAIPSLIFRRRYTIYCPWNAIDLVEWPASTAVAGSLRRLAIVFAVFVSLYFMVGRDLLGRVGIASPDQPLSWLLLVPAAVLGAGAAARAVRSVRDAAVRSDAMAAAAMVLLSFIFAGRLSQGLVFRAVLACGVAVAFARAARTRWLRSRSDAAGGGPPPVVESGLGEHGG